MRKFFKSSLLLLRKAFVKPLFYLFCQNWFDINSFIFIHTSIVGQPKFFWDFCLYVHGRRLAKSWLDTNFQPARTSFDHASEAPKLAVLAKKP